MNAWRRDLADIALAGELFAPHYARPLVRDCGLQSAPLWPTSRCEDVPISELLPGEAFGVLEYAGGSAWGSCQPDPLVGYVAAKLLIEAAEPSHIVSAARASIEPDPAAAGAIAAELPMGSRLVGDERGDRLVTAFGSVALGDVRRIDDPETDPVDVAELLMGAPYRPGGRSAGGIDAVGLVQLALSLCGIGVPRLVDLLDRVGAPVPADAETRRGDLVLFDGSAGLAMDAHRMIHSCPAAGLVRIDPLPVSVTARRRILL